MVIEKTIVIMSRRWFRSVLKDRDQTDQPEGRENVLTGGRSNEPTRERLKRPTKERLNNELERNEMDQSEKYRKGQPKKD
jgi:hypothetical protein